MREALYNMGLLIYARFGTFTWRLSRYLKDKSGASTVEYALLIAVIVVGVVTAASVIFKPLKEFFLSIVEKLKGMAK